MTAPTNAALATAILGQQEQLGKLADLVGALSAADVAHSNLILQLQQQIVGFGLTFQIFAELVMAASPDFKQQVAVATTQILARPDVANNATLRDLLSALNTAATMATRISS